MKNYEKPQVVSVEAASEGVYMASGSASSTDCWTVTGKSVQDWNGSHNVFEMSAVHSDAMEHISGNVDYVITFSAPITNAYSEFPAEFSGNTVTVSRTLLADAYKSGDVVTFKVWAQAADEATTKALTISSVTYTCRHEVNVQGKFD